MQTLNYQSPKWEKRKKELVQIGYDFSKAPNIDGYVRRLISSKMETMDYCQYFGSLTTLYLSWVTDAYLNNPHDPHIIDNVYCSGIAGVLIQQLGGLRLNQWESIFQRALYELVTISYTDICYFRENTFALSCMINGNLELAE